MRARARGPDRRTARPPQPPPPAPGAEPPGRGRKAGGRGPRPPLPSLQSFSQLHIHSRALPVGGGRRAPRGPAGRPPPGGRKRGDARCRPGSGGTPASRKGSQAHPKFRGPGEPGPARRDAGRALPPRARRGRVWQGAGARGEKAGLEPPGVSPARKRGAGGCTREPMPLQCARCHTREQVSSESSAGSARRRPRRAGGSISLAGLHSLYGRRGLETRGAGTAAPPPLPPRLTRLRGSPHSFPRPRADSGRALWRPVAGTPSCALPAPA